MDTLSFEPSFDPIQIDFYSEIDRDELDLQDLMDTDESTIVMDSKNYYFSFTLIIVFVLSQFLLNFALASRYD